MKFNIDFVVPWVDGDDPEWLELFNKYSPTKISASHDYYSSKKRYEDIGLLRYWFRCVEKNAPWVNKIFFVTNGQKPDWLNLAYEKLVWVKHEDFIDKQYLPVFSSHAIEMNLHRIKMLSDHFVYFNDDFFLINNVEPSHYFSPDGLPCDYAILDVLPTHTPWGHTLLNDLIEINAHFNIRDVISANKKKWYNIKYERKDMLKTLFFHKIRPRNFPGFKARHFSQPYLKDTFAEVWRNCEDSLRETSSRKFRNIENVNQYIFRYWQLVTGNFIPFVPRYKVFFWNTKNLEKVLSKQKIKEICINDGKKCEETIALFQKFYPQKSKFEL